MQWNFQFVNCVEIALIFREVSPDTYNLNLLAIPLVRAPYLLMRRTGIRIPPWQKLVWQLKVEGQALYNGDPDMIFLPDIDSLAQRHSRWHFSIPSPCAHCAVPTRFWRGLCREAYRDPDYLNWLASPLVKAPYCWSGGQDLNPRRDRTWRAYWKWKTPLGARLLQWWPRRDNLACNRLTCPTPQQITLL